MCMNECELWNKNEQMEWAERSERRAAKERVRLWVRMYISAVLAAKFCEWMRGFRNGKCDGLKIQKTFHSHKSRWLKTTVEAGKIVRCAFGKWFSLCLVFGARWWMENNEMKPRKWIFLNNNRKFISSNINFSFRTGNVCEADTFEGFVEMEKEIGWAKSKQLDFA